MSPRPGRPVQRSPAAASRPADGPLLEVWLRGEPVELPTSEAFGRLGGRLRLLSCRLSVDPPGRLVRWIQVDASRPSVQRLVSDLAHRIGPTNVSSSVVTANRALVRLVEPLPGVCAAAFADGALCLRCPLLPGGDGPSRTVRLLVPPSSTPRRLRATLSRRVGLPAAIERTGVFHPSRGMTARQEEALRIAHDLGYFNYPRSAGLREVAAALKVTRSTALELLRRATSRMTSLRYEDDRTSELA